MRYDGEHAGLSRAGAATGVPRPLDGVRTRLRPKNYSLRPEEADFYWIRRYIGDSGRRHPATLDGKVVEAFLTRLAPRQVTYERPEPSPVGAAVPFLAEETEKTVPGSLPNS